MIRKRVRNMVENMLEHEHKKEIAFETKLCQVEKEILSEIEEDCVQNLEEMKYMMNLEDQFTFLFCIYSFIKLFIYIFRR